jgi:hypothetical protein
VATKRKKTAMKHIFENWRTTLGGLIILATQAGEAMGYITPEVSQNITALAVSIGLIVASDGSFVQTLFAIFSKSK